MQLLYVGDGVEHLLRPKLVVGAYQYDAKAVCVALHLDAQRIVEPRKSSCPQITQIFADETTTKAG